MQWLAGRKRLETLERVFDGEVDLPGALTLDQVVDVVSLVRRKLESLVLEQGLERGQ